MENKDNKTYDEIVKEIEKKDKELKDAHLKLVLFNNQSVLPNLPLDTNSDIYKEYTRLKTNKENIENNLDDSLNELVPIKDVPKKKSNSIINDVLKELPQNEMFLELPKTKLEELKEKGDLVLKEPCKTYENSNSFFSDLVDDIDINAIREGYKGDLGSFSSNLSDILDGTNLSNVKDEILKEVKDNLTTDTKLDKKEFTKFEMESLGDIDINSLKDLLDFKLEIPSLPDFTVPGTGAIVKIIMLTLKEGLKSAKKGIVEQLKSQLVKILVSNINKNKEKIKEEIKKNTDPTKGLIDKNIKKGTDFIDSKTDNLTDIQNKVSDKIGSIPKTDSQIKSKTSAEIKKLEKKLKNYC